MAEKMMLLAAPVYLFLGLTTGSFPYSFSSLKILPISAFWISIYPATLIYSKTLAEHDNLQAFYIIALGFGEISS